MITRAAIDERVRQWGLPEHVVEKDYVIGWLLWGIGANAELGEAWVFKGGTSLKKCFVETYRFSEDLDFTVRPGGPLSPDEVVPLLRSVLERVSEESGLNLLVREPKLQLRPGGESAEGRVYYIGPRETPEAASVKLDLDRSEAIVLPTDRRSIAHAYDDVLPPPAAVQCYAFEEVFAEKLRALGQRCLPRDLYDVITLVRRDELRTQHAAVRDALARKCAARGVPVPTLSAMQSSPLRVELEAEWKNMLGHQLPALPDFQAFWDALPELFAWLDGTPAPALALLPVRSDVNRAWVAPPTIRLWPTGAPLELVRFAGRNRLCVEMSYRDEQGRRSERVIEPYSLKQTKAGDLVLYAVDVAKDAIRSFRTDGIQRLRPTNRQFTPRYRVEF